MPSQRTEEADEGHWGARVPQHWWQGNGQALSPATFILSALIYAKESVLIATATTLGSHAFWYLKSSHMQLINMFSCIWTSPFTASLLPPIKQPGSTVLSEVSAASAAASQAIPGGTAAPASAGDPYIRCHFLRWQNHLFFWPSEKRSSNSEATYPTKYKKETQLQKHSEGWSQDSCTTHRSLCRLCPWRPASSKDFSRCFVAHLF